MSPTRPAHSPFSRLADLLLWTTACAFGFSAYNFANPGLNPTFRIVGYLYDLLMGTAFGTFLTGSILLAQRRLQNPDPPSLLPGHALLLFGLAASLANAIACLTYLSFWHPRPMPSCYWFQFSGSYALNLDELKQQAIAWSLGAVAALLFSLRLWPRLPGRWRLVFLTFFLGSATLATGLIACLLVFPSAIFTWTSSTLPRYVSVQLAGLLSIIFAWARDRPTQKDQLHTIGILTWLLVGITQLAATWAYNSL